MYLGKIKVKVNQEQAMKALRGSRCIAIPLFFKLGFRGAGGQSNATSPVPLEIAGSHCVRSWMDHRADLDGCGISRRHRDSILEPSSP